MNKFDERIQKAKNQPVADSTPVTGNPFDHQIKHARNTHLKTTLVAGGIIVPAAFILMLWLLFAKGYTVNVAPNDARETAHMNLVSGIGVFYDNKLYTLGGEVSFATTAKGYISHTEPLNKGSEQTVNIVLKPKPGRILARTIPEVAEVAWYMDGKLIEVSQTLTTEVQPGRHQIKLNSAHHEIISESFDILKDEEKSWAFELIPVPGKLTIGSRPGGAEVRLNGVSVGSTPLKLDRPGGDYQLQISKSGYEPIEERIALTNSTRQADRDYTLVAKKGFVTFALEPSGGSLLVNGKQVNDSSRVPLASNQVHSVSYQRAGYYSYNNKLTLEPGSEKTVRIGLKREYGKVMLKATPTARVVIDGKSMGHSPVETRLPAVSHKIEFKKPYYRTVVKNITPNGKTTSLADVTLLTEYDARRRDKIPTQAQKMGIKMANFRPDKVTLGTKANEKGRRRNEHLRQVKFTRGVAVSRHEISEDQFAQFRAAQGKSKSNLPVTDVSWLDAAQFCNWLSEKDGLPPFYKLTGGQYQGVNAQSKGYRLPSEAEWEWLAKRAKRAEGTKYVWGNIDRVPEKAGNFSDESASDNKFTLKGYEDGHEGKAPVGSFKADRIGLFDLAGNVSEWVHDRYTNVPPDPNKLLKDPLGPSRGKSHLYKGSSFKSGRIKELRTGWREPAADKSDTVGFRIARYF